MNNEIIAKVQQKKAAMEKAQWKIDTIERSIEGKQITLAKLKEEQAKKQADLDRMEELAGKHATLQERFDEVAGRMREMQQSHVYDPTDPESVKLADNTEYVGLKQEWEDLKPQVEEIGPLVRAIFYGKA